MDMDYAINVNDLSLSYNTVPIYTAISGVFQKGTMTAIIGPNGGGKSTFLKTLMGFIKPTSGNIHYTVKSQEIAYLPQTNEIDRSFPLTVQDVVELGLCQHTGFFNDLKHSSSFLKKIIYTMGLSDICFYPLDNLSGGQFQRVLFARMAMQQASLIMLDEPFSAIDATTVHDLMNIIKKWHYKGKTIIMVTHDLNLVKEYFPYTLMLARECIAWGQTADVLQPENLRKMQTLYNDPCLQLYCPNNPTNSSVLFI